MLVRRVIKVVYNKVYILWLLKIASCSDGILQFVALLREDFAFIKGS